MQPPIRTLRYLTIAIVFTVIWLNLHAVAVISEVAPGASAWYPARGLSLALLLIFGLRFIPALFVASVIGGIPYHLPDHPEHLFASAAIITCAMGGAAWVLLRFRFNAELRLRDVVGFIVISAAAALLTAAGVVGINVRSGFVDAAAYADVVLQFFVGDYLGILIVTPLLVLLAAKGFSRRVWRGVLSLAEGQGFRGVGEGLLIAAIGAVWLWLGVAEEAGEFSVSQHSRWYLLLLPLALAAIRFGTLGAAVASVTLSIAIVMVVREAGAYVVLIDLQLLLLTFSVVSLLLGAAGADRQRSVEALALLHRREAERARREAEHARQSKARFLAATTHDLRPPFEAVRLGLETLKLQTLSAEAMTVLARTESASRSLSRVLESVLDTTRVEGEIRSVAPRALALGPLLMRAVRETAHHHPLCSAAVRAVPTTVGVIGDRVLIERVVRNLLTNAIRATTESGKVRVVVRRRGMVVRVEVHDTGSGIEADRLPLIFKDFVSGSTDGMGIGLSLVREISDQLGYGLRARSQVGRGTVFCVELPLSAGAIREHAVCRSIEKLRDRVVAVALSEVVRREVLSAVLSNWGAAVVTAANRDAALRELAHMGSRADLFVVDDAADRPGPRGSAIVVLEQGNHPLSADLDRILDRLD